MQLNPMLRLILTTACAFMVTGSVAFAQDPVREAAFNDVVNNTFPMTPQEIQQFKNIAAKQAEANAQPAGAQPPIGTSNIIPVTFKPGELMPIIRVGQGMITSAVFTDAAGKVWPIVSYTVGDASAFNINWDKKSGVLMIQGQKLYAQTNMGVLLEGMDVPVMLSLVIGQNKWDYLDYIRVSENELVGNGQVQAAPQVPAFLNNVLMGIAPDGSKAMQVSGADAQVWSYQGNYLLLTRATLLSPAWKSRLNSGGTDPYHAYILPKSPLILLSNQGNVENLRVLEESDND